MNIKRGDIYYADLSPVIGSEQGGLRPVLIVQNDVGNKYSPTVIAAAIICPIVNTGVFLIGCLLFFMEPVTAWGEALGFSNVGEYMFLGLAGGNFLVEMGINIVLTPVILRLINLIKKNKV